MPHLLVKRNFFTAATRLASLFPIPNSQFLSVAENHDLARGGIPATDESLD